ncbi:MAG: nucleoside 2-deoxyribosyltransferase [Solirubrobacteraceae bacterium]|nr:nucleoside 2-deoxyribosyltransferase [Solirubrobacteraceae bacterium]
MSSVYVASPYGFSPATRGYYDDVLLPALRSAGWTPLDPWADDDGSIASAFASAESLAGSPAYQRALRELDARIGAANEQLIRSADALLAVLDGSDVDSGTAAEIGFAAALGIPAAGLRLDTRRTGDNAGVTVNLQVEHWLPLGVHRTVEAAVLGLAPAQR